MLHSSLSIFTSYSLLRTVKILQTGIYLKACNCNLSGKFYSTSIYYAMLGKHIRTVCKGYNTICPWVSAASDVLAVAERVEMYRLPAGQTPLRDLLSTHADQQTPPSEEIKKKLAAVAKKNNLHTAQLTLLVSSTMTTCSTLL